MLKIQIADNDIDINSHNYHKIDTRNLRLGLVHGWHYTVGNLSLVFVWGLVSYCSGTPGGDMVWYGMVWYAIVEFNVPFDTV